MDPAPSDGAEPADGASTPSDASAASDGASAASSTPSTHVYVVLIDDAGFNDVGYQSADLGAATPFVDSLAESGVQLKRYYTHTSCTPSRSALLSGMFASSVGMQEKDVLSDSPFGLPESTTFSCMPTLDANMPLRSADRDGVQLVCV